MWFGERDPVRAAMPAGVTSGCYLTSSMSNVADTGFGPPAFGVTVNAVAPEFVTERTSPGAAVMSVTIVIWLVPLRARPGLHQLRAIDGEDELGGLVTDTWTDTR